MTERARGSTKQDPRLTYLAVIGSALLVHISYIQNGFVWLDHGDIEAGRAILPLPQIWRAFFTPFGATGFYRPIVTIANSIDYSLYQNWATGYHFTNLLLHIAVAASSVPFFSQFVRLNNSECLLAGLIIAVHPLSSLPVGVITYRPELLATLFTVLSCVFHVKFRLGAHFINGIAAVICFILALLSKESACLWLPGFILIWELSAGRDKALRRKVLIPTEIFLLMFSLYWRYHVLGQVWHLTPGHPESINLTLTRLSVIGTRLLELFSPFVPAVSDATRLCSGLCVRAVATVVVIAVSVWFFFRNAPSSRLRPMLAAFGLSIIPGFNLIPLPRFSSPHYGYFPTIALAALVAIGAGEFLRSVKYNTLFRRLFAVWFLTASVSTFAGGYRFQSDATLFGPEAERDPDFREGRFYLGDYYARNDDLTKARKFYEEAIRENSEVIAYVDYNSLLINYAGVLLRVGELGKADETLKKASEISSELELPTIAYNRAVIAFKRGDYRAAENLLKPNLPKFSRPEPLLLYAQALEIQGRRSEAEAVLDLYFGEK